MLDQTRVSAPARYDARLHPISRFYQNMDLRGIEISNESSAGPGAPPLAPTQPPPSIPDDATPSEASGADVSTGDDFRGIPVSWGVSAKEEGKKHVKIQFCDMADPDIQHKLLSSPRYASCTKGTGFFPPGTITWIRDFLLKKLKAGTLGAVNPASSAVSTSTVGAAAAEQSAWAAEASAAAGVSNLNTAPLDFLAFVAKGKEDEDTNKVRVLAVPAEPVRSAPRVKATPRASTRARKHSKKTVAPANNGDDDAKRQTQSEDSGAPGERQGRGRGRGRGQGPGRGRGGGGNRVALLEQDEREIMDVAGDGDAQGGAIAHSAAAAMAVLGDVHGGARPAPELYNSTKIPNFTMPLPDPDPCSEIPGAASSILPPVGGASQTAYFQHAANANALMESTEVSTQRACTGSPWAFTTLVLVRALIPIRAHPVGFRDCRGKR
mmetsp:Transcript_83529/g.235598  ORF Transcript_83529/g.235598 Transcript_83529/m.235598 type:complete len:437 (-) Transcript_83529:326-1636(-)